MKCAYITLALTTSALAANFDGHWVSKVENKKGAQEIVFNLKAEGDGVTGTVAAGKRGRSLAISDGKISGDQISFTTTGKGKKRSASGKILWKARIEGEQLKGTRQVEGRKARPFSATRDARPGG